jgi:hypothetical protein
LHQSESKRKRKAAEQPADIVTDTQRLVTERYIKMLNVVSYLVVSRRQEGI